MKILILIDSLRSGGRERRLLELSAYLKQNTDIEIHIVLTDPIIEYDYVHELGIPISIIYKNGMSRIIGIFYRFFKLNQIVRIFKPDIINVWEHNLAFYASIIAKIYNLPLLNNQIADAMPRPSMFSFQNAIWQINHQFSDKMIANSLAGLKIYNVKKEKGVVIYNGVNLNRFENLTNPKLIRLKYGITTKYAIIMVANLTNNKDHVTLINVARQIYSQRNDVIFIAAGDGPNKNILINEIKKNGPKNLIFIGKISRVEELINACDIGLLLTYTEGISNSIIEYMALNKPVIATIGGGTSELIKDNVTGFLINGKDVASISEKINQLLDNEDLRRKMGEKGREIIENNFSIDYMGKQFVNLYLEYLVSPEKE